MLPYPRALFYDGPPSIKWHPLMQDPSIDLKRHAEAARYALLRRLAPAMRHQMAGSFQPVTMMAAIIEKRLRAATADLPALAKTSGDVRALATAATRSSLDLMMWIAPDPQTRVALGQGIQDALQLVATELSFMGFKFDNQTEGLATEVALHHVRGVFVAGLLALTDAAASPANVLLAASREGRDMVVAIALAAVEPAAAASAPSEEFHVGLATYRPIDWDDVEAIAAADGAYVQHAPMNLMLRLPVASG